MTMMQGSVTSLFLVLSIFCSPSWVHAQQQELRVRPPGDSFTKPVGDSVVMTCSLEMADGDTADDEVVLSWLDDGGQEVSSVTGRMYVESDDSRTKKLYITSIQSGDEGTFTCTAEGRRIQLRKSIQLLLFKEITFDDAPSQQSLAIHMDAVIVCRTSGNPAPQVSWRFKGRRLTNGDRYSVTADGLRVLGVSSFDEGEYTCRAEVEADGRYDERRIHVEVHGAWSEAPYRWSTRPTGSVSMSQTSYSSCEVYCLSGGNLRCIPTSWLCDGISDCDYNSDENSERCGARSEAPYHWSARPTGAWSEVPYRWSTRPTGAWSEAPYRWSTRPGESVSMSQTSYSSCEVYCLSGGNLRCIPTSWLCDGISDCDYNSDENSERCGSRSEAPYHWSSRPTGAGSEAPYRWSTRPTGAGSEAPYRWSTRPTDSNLMPETSQMTARLVGSGLPHEGRLEVYHNGIWGTVCDDSFENREASVACRSLGSEAGFRYGTAIGNTYGPGTGQIWLDDLDCNRTETNIGDCRHRGWGSHNCVHSEDISIRCYTK